MPKVIPYKAIRPIKEKVNLIVSKSLDNYSKNQLKNILEENPISFLHILKSGYKKKQNVSTKKRYLSVLERYKNFKEQGYFIQDNKPSFYIYKIITKNYTFCGIFAGVSTDDYKNNAIKKHENTIHSRKTLFKKYLKTVRFNAEPVLLTYPDNTIINSIINEVTSEEPEYKFIIDEKVTHHLWKLSANEKIVQIQNEFAKIKALYIADGHHRCASSYLLAESLKAENSNHTGNEAYNYFMAYLIPESNLKIFEFNRLVKDLNGLSNEDFLSEVSQHFHIQNKGSKLFKPSKKHEFSMYLNGSFYSLTLNGSIYKFTDELSKLDVQILYLTILNPILKIKNLKNNTRIEYGHGKNNINEMKKLVDKRKFAVAFGLFPIEVEEIKKIADKDLQMPPKSTYIEPKLLSALTIYEL